ncbi:MAG: dCTP deaminase [Deltaproteobacteria bacterium]|nr:dCTP deaminase [Deltaproteobacteria bacterium]
MSVQSDRWIRKMALELGMIEPFEEQQVRAGISFGLSSYGYDFRIDRTFKVPNLASKKLFDPKAVASDDFTDVVGDACDIPAGSYVLGHTVEYFRIPRDVITIAFGKSTYARSGVLVNVTPFEPEWEGHATIAIVNTSQRPVRIYAGEGIGQILFLQAAEPCAISYADKKGKYQASRGITTAKGKG